MCVECSTSTAASTRRLAVTSDNGTATSVSDSYYHTGYRPGNLTLIERQPSSVKCSVTGGYPPPSLQLYLNDQDISRQFHFQNKPHLKGTVGLRDIVYESERWSHVYTASAEDDGKKLKCIATVPGLKSNISLVILSVHCKFTNIMYLL